MKTKTATVNPDQMNAEQAAAYLGFKESTLADWRSDGAEDGPPYVKLKGRVFYYRSQLDRWIAKNQVNPVK